MEESILWQIILQVVLIISNAIFACAEIAVISVNGAKLDQLTAQGDARAGRLKKLTDNPATFLATIQVAITLSGFLASAFAADNFSSRLVAVFVALGVPAPREDARHYLGRHNHAHSFLHHAHLRRARA